MLAIRNLTKQFYQRNQEITVVSKLSLSVKKGRVFGLIGPNGAGKTTTVKLTAGLLFPTQGKITIGGDPAGSIAAKRRIGFMNENPQFYYHLKAREVMEFVADLFGLDKAEVATRSEALLKEVGLLEAKDTTVRQFSKGMHQRLAFAVAQINRPELLILDEPLDGLDPLGRQDFKRMIRQLKAQGTTIFFSSHILSDVEEICDEVAIMHLGKIINQGRPSDLIKGSKLTLEEMFVRSIRNA